MGARGRRAFANRHAHQEAEDPERYNMRCVQCAEMHRACNRAKPCNNCTGAGRIATCRFPEKARRTTVEYKGKKQRWNDENSDDDDEKEEEDEEEEEEEEEGNDEGFEESEVPEVEMSSEPIGSSPPEPIPPREPRHKSQAWTVAMHFARAQVQHQAEAIAADPTVGFINPRIRPELDPNLNVTIDPQLQGQRPNSLGGFSNHQEINQNVDEHLGNQQTNNENAYSGDLQDFTEDVHEGFNMEFPAFTNNGRYTLANASLEHHCMELRSNGNECYNPCTFPCEGDHSHMDYNPHHVCHDCRAEPDLYNVAEEEEMIAKHRLYFCAECTRDRATGPAAQLWEHPRRFAEVKTRRVNKCSCHDELQKGWICEEHRTLKAEYIQKWGPEHVKSFRVFFGDDFCGACRKNPPQTDGAQVMWQCAHCKDIVLQA